MQSRRAFEFEGSVEKEEIVEFKCQCRRRSPENDSFWIGGNLETFLPGSLMGGKIENVGGWFCQGVFNIIAENLQRWPMFLGHVGGTEAPIAIVAIMQRNESSQTNSRDCDSVVSE